ncbi:VirB8/TrbF family protein [Helicobacter pylori]|uniref:ComB8 competence protein n=2 Tax=Helicobacter pylori TaxID=210 RepID=T0GAP3_HELPX|nr:VirB8/TrbF family protein [Helicobacter pylori]EPZ93077.1 comB8 competence protein [Helicobacter pylori UM114]
MSNLQEIREHLKELENSFEIGSFSKEYIKEYAKCFFMGLSMFLEQQKEEQDKENKEKDCHKEQLLNQDDKEYKEELIKSIQTNIAKNQELEKISFEKWENKIQERVLPKLKHIVTHKLQESITSSINTQLESFKKDELDLSSVFEIQRKNTQIAYRLAIGGLIGIIALSIAIFIMMPLKENTPYFIDFANSDKHFAVVQRADTKVDYGEAFLRNLVGSYITTRETINHIDDKIRLNEIIREQSSEEVWKTLEQLVSGKGSIYSNSNMDREIKIINISIYKQGKQQNIAVADIVAKVFDKGYLISEKRYRVSLIYHFKPLIQFDYSSMPKNPTGFIVDKYSLSEIASIKALDKTYKKVERPHSKIEYKKQNPTNPQNNPANMPNNKEEQ